jgi:hypothetical protein
MRYFKATFNLRQWAAPVLDDASGDKVMKRLPDNPGEYDVKRGDDSELTLNQLQGILSPRPPYDVVINEVTENGEFIKQIYPT